MIRQLCVTATSEPRVCNRSSLTVKRLKKKQKNLRFTRSLIYFTSSLFYKYPARFILSSSQVFKNPKKPSMIATESLQKKETIRFIVANWHRLGFQIGSETSSVPFFWADAPTNLHPLVRVPALRRAPLTMTPKKINVVLSSKLPRICMKITYICRGWRVAY